MPQVKIISGVYGYRPPKSKVITSAKAGDVVSVPEEEAARLVRLKVAVMAESEPAPKPKNKGKPEESQPVFSAAEPEIII